MTQTLQRRLLNLVMVMYAYNSQEMEAGRPGVHSHFQLYSKLKATLGYMKPCLRKMKKKCGGGETKATSLKGDSGTSLIEKVTRYKKIL